MKQEIEEVIEKELMVEYIVDHEAHKASLEDIKEGLRHKYYQISNDDVLALYNKYKKLENIKTL